MQIASRRAALVSSFATAAFVTLGASHALANSGTLLPLDQYQAGTEQVQNTIVTNGKFETTAANQPAGWTPNGTFQSATPTGPNTSAAVNGSFAAQGPLGSAQQRNGYTQTVTLAPGTDYVLSAYLWNFSPINFDLTLAEVRGPGSTKTISLAPSDGGIDGSRGVFGFRSFNSDQLGVGTITLEVAFEYDAAASPAFPAGRPSLSGQIDNVAITPADQFAPPVLAPEPTALAFAAVAGTSMLARRRRGR